MTCLTLTHQNRASFTASLHAQSWIMACLCADWCNTCKSYQSLFAALALRFPEVQLVWIDIEDQADVVGDLDIENFPTILIQQGHQVLFFGTMLPEIQLAERLLQSKLSASGEERIMQAELLLRQRLGQGECDIWHLLQNID